MKKVTPNTITCKALMAWLLEAPEFHRVLFNAANDPDQPDRGQRVLALICSDINRRGDPRAVHTEVWARENSQILCEQTK